MSDLSSPFSVIWRERFFIHLTVSPSLFSFLWLILVSLSKSCCSTCSIWADDLCLSAHSLASVVLPLMQLLEFINRKNSVILKVAFEDQCPEFLQGSRSPRHSLILLSSWSCSPWRLAYR